MADVSRYASGSGPGAITDDGCAVELYRHLKPAGEPEIVVGLVSAGASVLDLGAGAGRIANALTRLGYVVTAVDQSAEMLQSVAGERIAGSIETLELGDRRFDAVLLSSYLLNTPDIVQRAAFVATCQRYAKRDGAVLVQVRGSRILDDLSGFTREHEGMRDVVEHYRREGLKVTMRWRTEIGKAAWVQTFTHEYLGENQLRALLADNGLEFIRWLDSSREWLLCAPAGDPAQ